ncbi:MATH domain and coiled-coil domain-containing protein At1g31390-like [Eucalyptus grandis]|uniref:MATH domain and coiled-coil domain-containing protein At1g31390-like n=1 Tax=Eucalyptus grandis TaxID=71139 RepID=UPI00192E9FB9|nr:MATH domain and coiled-coil domain-containing protein At1g31390-like [Eucalyptus grandis]
MTPVSSEWRFSSSRAQELANVFSDVFTAGDHKWKVTLFPRGNLANRGQSLSMYLVLVDEDNLASGQKVNVRFILRLKDQNNIIRGQQGCTTAWFSSSAPNRGWHTFMPLKTVGTCLMEDSCVIQAQVMVLGTFNKLP